MSLPQENRAPSRMERAIEVLDRLFAGRRDTYAFFDPGPDGRGVAYSGDRCAEPLTEEVWREHIRGNRPIGVYPLVKIEDEWVSSWACIDIDQDKIPGRALEMARSVAESIQVKLAEPLSGHIEITKSGQIHFWLFFEEPTAAWKVRALARLALEVSGLKPYKKGKGDEVVICPPHDSPPPKDKSGRGGVGSCIWIPWYGNNAKDGRQVFFDPSIGAPFPDQLGAMESCQRISPSTVAHLIDAHDLKPSNVKPIAPKSDDDRVVLKAPAESIPKLADVEFVNLCAKLPALRAMRENPGGCSYKDWFAGMMHLAPFADGRDRAHQLSRMDSSRYDGGITDRQWRAAVELYSREEGQSEARVSQRIVEFWRAGGRPDIQPISPNWAIWNGCFCKRKLGESGAEKDPIPISNFTASVICEESIDDGTGNRSKCVRLRGSLMTGQVLPEIVIPTSEWTAIKVWLHKGWGFRPVIYGDDRQVLQCIALCGQEAPERAQYTHTGWTLIDGRPLFLTPHGPRGGGPLSSGSAFDETARVVAPEKLRNYNIPESTTEAEAAEAFLWIERFLDCGSLEATAPVMAAIFLAPLASYLNLDFGVFLTGHTGTHKSSLVAAAMAVWGSRWSKDTLPASFNSTANALEGLAFAAKDLPLPIDNYVPSQKGDAQATLKRISHSFGDHSGRDRMNAKAELVAAKPFRSFPILTGEDVPYAAGAGATNRYYIVPMQRETLRLLDLEAVQEAGWAGKMAPAMTHYLTWLTVKMADPEWVSKVVAYQYRLEKEARRAASGKDHDRLTAQTAWIRTGIELMRQAHPKRVWADPSLDGRIADAFNVAIESRRTISAEASLPYRFLSSIQYLVQSGVFHGVECCRKVDGTIEQRAPSNKMIAQLLGWSSIDQAPFYVLHRRDSRLGLWVTDCDGDNIENAYLCIRGLEMLTEIRQVLKAECPIVEGVRGIASALQSDEILRKSGKSGRIGMAATLKTGEPEIEVWKLRMTKVLQILGYMDGEVSPPQAL